jgi:hypothetical protein
LTSCVSLPPIGGQVPNSLDVNIKTSVQPYAVGSLSLPLGAHRIPNTSYVVLRQDHSPSAAGFLFGPLGLLTKDASLKAESNEKVEKTQNLFSYKLDLATEEKISALSTNSGKFRLHKNDNEKGGIKLTPYVWIGTYKNGKSRIHVILEARNDDANGKTIWWNKYIYYSEQALPLTGSNSWTQDSGELIKKITDTGLGKVLDVFILDINHGLPRNDNIVKYTAPYLAFPIPVAIDGTKLLNDANYTIIENRIGWGGIHIIPNAEVSTAYK